MVITLKLSDWYETLPKEDYFLSLEYRLNYLHKFKYVGSISFKSGISGQQPEMPTAGPNLAQSVVIPQIVIYGQLFRHIKALKEKVTEFQQQGQNVSWFNSFYQKEANLNAVESDELERLRIECKADC